MAVEPPPCAPGSAGDAFVAFVFLECANAYFVIAAELDARLGHETVRQARRELLDDDAWPKTVRAFPRGAFGYRRPEVIAQRHGFLLVLVPMLAAAASLIQGTGNGWLWIVVERNLL